MTNKFLYLAFLFLLTFFSCNQKKESKIMEKKPNILYIWTDQQIFGMLSAEGNKYIKTPNLDRLAKEGAMFTNAFCTMPSCSPARATVVSGAYAHKHKMYDNVRPIKSGKGSEGFKPQDGYKITQQYFYENGYKVSHAGKWHAGLKSDFGECFTADKYYSEDYAPLWDEKYKDKINEKYPWDYKTRTGKGGYVKSKNDIPFELTPSWQKAFDSGKLSNWAVVGKILLPAEETEEAAIIENTMKFIDENKNRPWMTTISLHPPHDPWGVPEPYYSEIAVPLMAKMEIKGNGKDQKTSLSSQVGDLVGEQGIKDYMAIYHAQVVLMDDLLGKVFDQLDSLKLADNTLIIFSSDHGDMHGMHNNVGKINNNLYNTLYSVPCLVRYPNKIKGGQVINKPVMHTDFMPTFLDYADIALENEIDGKSLRPLLENPKADWRDYHLLEKYMDVYRNEDHTIKDLDKFYYAMGIEDGTYKYIYTRTNNKKMNAKYCGPRLIDLKNDPFEENNLFENEAYKETVITYHKRLKAILKKDKFDYIYEYVDNPWSIR